MRWRSIGFATRLEQDLFERLIGVSGIGPKVGWPYCRGSSRSILIRAIERGDLARLTAIPGVGKKTSERIRSRAEGSAAAPRGRGGG
jgi:Holliday junction DNA helicase RuvA